MLDTGPLGMVTNPKTSSAICQEVSKSLGSDTLTPFPSRLKLLLQQLSIVNT